ncbi:thioredoxin-like protein [Obelidium mucronatum]|nr:thioredoxin-like protein [Obelidium mucronatum]
MDTTDCAECDHHKAQQQQQTQQNIKQSIPQPLEPIEFDEDALFAELEEDDDHLLAEMRERRMEELRAEMMLAQEKMASVHHGSYENILSEKEVLSITTSIDKVVVHFYHKEFRRCQIMDRHLGTLARKHPKTRFIKIDVEVCPFLVDRLKVKVLPCVIPFVDGVSVERLIGFEELGESDSFQTAMLERRLAEAKVIDLDARETTSGPRKTIFGFSEPNKDEDAYDSDD